MKAKWIVAGTLALVLATLGPGCVANDKSLEIVFNVAPNAQCQFVVQTGTSVNYIPSGVLDLAVDHIYMLTPQIDNNMPINTNDEEKDINALDVQLQRAQITYQWPVGRDIIATYPNLMDLEKQDPFIAPISGVVSAADTSGQPGKMVTEFPLFSSQTQLDLSGLTAADAYNVALSARVKVFGQTLGGSPIQSNEFIYPIYFCRGCAANLICCAGTTSEKPQEFCIEGQDSGLPCSAC